tara:strand:- start:221 stop:517 length:297 start_codon:yes stop_codon:yes gene_type:complete
VEEWARKGWVNLSRDQKTYLKAWLDITRQIPFAATIGGRIHRYADEFLVLRNMQKSSPIVPTLINPSFINHPEISIHVKKGQTGSCTNCTMHIIPITP